MKTTFFSKALVALTVLAAALTSCDKDVFDPSEKDGGAYISSEYAPLSNTLDGEENFTEFVKALRYSGTFNALNQSSDGMSFTVFVPNNAAMADFYSSRGVNALEELTPDYVRHFVLCHTVKDSISADDFVMLSKITNLENDVITVAIDPDHVGQATLNDNVNVIEMDIMASNGRIYVLSGALTPLVETAVDRINEAGNSKIMSKALETTGWAKEISTLADTVVVICM